MFLYKLKCIKYLTVIAMKKVLIISYYFPPDPAIGSLRMGGLAKYFSEFKWEPIVLTKNIPTNNNYRIRIIKTPYSNHDSLDSLKRKIGINPKSSVSNQLKVSTKNNAKIITESLYVASEIFTYPDPNKDWYSYAFKTASNLLDNEKIDAIISSSSPVTCHIIANGLKKRYNIPWIADLRDLWTQNHYYPYSKVRMFFERKLELKSLSTADSLTTVSLDLKSKLETLHEGIPVYSITNGFDLDEMNNSQVNFSTKFTITYTGSLYQGRRDPSKLFQALNELILEKKVNSEKMEIRFYGRQEKWVQNEIETYNLQKIVTDYGLVSRDIALLKQRESQLLLLFLWDHPSEIGVYTGKLFEYLASKRPILTIGGQKGVVSELLNDTQAGVFVSNVNEIKSVIEKYYNEYISYGQVLYKGNYSIIEKYSQKEMTRKFSDILDKITDLSQSS
jgi:hypothetical protein